jgi:hypothetical protein
MTQSELEDLFSKDLLSKQLKVQITKDSSLSFLYKRIIADDNITINEAYAFVSALVTQQGKPVPLQTFALKIGFQLTSSPNKAAILGLSVLDKTKYLDVFTITSGGQVRFKGEYGDVKTRALLLLKCYLPPMVEKPTDPENPYKKVRYNLILSKEPSITDRELYEYYPTDVLSKLNGIEWTQVKTTAPSSCAYPKMEALVRQAVGNKFYFTHSYDFRGRIYANGYHLNYQGTPYDKASLDFNSSETLSEDGEDCLYVDLANYIGLSKSDYADRIAGAKEFVDKRKRLDKADSKYPLARKALDAILKYRKDPSKPLRHSMHIDASASGLQLMSVLAKDHIGMELTNLLSNSYIDPYGTVAETLNKCVGTEYSRSEVKTSIMTTSYNSVANPMSVFSKHYDKYMQIFSSVFSGAQKVMKLLNHYFDKQKDIHSWVMPDGFTVHMPTYQKYVNKVQSKWGQLNFMVHKVNPAPENWRSLVPNIIHSVDGWVCRETIRRFNGTMATIHDCFRVHPNHVKEAQLAYNGVMADLYNSNMLEYLVAQLRGEPIDYKVSREESSTVESVRYAMYSLS